MQNTLKEQLKYTNLEGEAIHINLVSQINIIFSLKMKDVRSMSLNQVFTAIERKELGLVVFCLFVF